MARGRYTFRCLLKAFKVLFSPGDKFFQTHDVLNWNVDVLFKKHKFDSCKSLICFCLQKEIPNITFSENSDCLNEDVDVKKNSTRRRPLGNNTIRGETDEHFGARMFQHLEGIRFNIFFGSKSHSLLFFSRNSTLRPVVSISVDEARAMFISAT